jgi:diguanylate cyclase (GGDEF)-like protein
MSQLVNKLADLTAVRDRAALDKALVSTLNDLLQPQSVAIYRTVGEEGNERWLASAQLSAGQIEPTSDSAWSELDSLPRLCEHPLRVRAASGELAQSTDGRLVVFPVISGLTSVAILELISKQAIADEARRLVSGVLRLFVNFQGLLDYGERDALTDLLNRKTFDGAFMKATIKQKVSPESMPGERRDPASTGSYWLAMLDIDHFKLVNDNFGHLIGDEVLLLLARLMRSCFRFHDQLYRFGGEEFVVLMRCNSELEAMRALERLRNATQEFLFPQVGTITISIGFSEVKSGDTPSGAFERADKAVYYAKEHGRNQVSSYATLIASGALQEQAVNVGDVELF